MKYLSPGLPIEGINPRQGTIKKKQASVPHNSDLRVDTIEPGTAQYTYFVAIHSCRISFIDESRRSLQTSFHAMQNIQHYLNTHPHETRRTLQIPLSSTRNV